MIAYIILNEGGMIYIYKIHTVIFNHFTLTGAQPYLLNHLQIYNISCAAT